MSESVIVKEVYNEKIYLRETTEEEETAISWGIRLIGLAMMIVPIIVMLVHPAVRVESNARMLIISVMFGGIVCFTQMLFGFGRKHIPVYYVYITGCGDVGTTIKKTTPEEDQKAICKVVQIKEAKAKEHYTKCLGMHDIAMNCK